MKASLLADCTRIHPPYPGMSLGMPLFTVGVHHADLTVAVPQYQVKLLLFVEIVAKLRSCKVPQVLGSELS